MTIKLSPPIVIALAGVIGYVPVASLSRDRGGAPAQRVVACTRPPARTSGWIPPAFPEGYVVERLPATLEFREIVAGLALDKLNGDWEKALALASHLIERAGDFGPIRADPLITYRAIRDGYGYCADFVKAFLALVHAAGLTARQWAFIASMDSADTATHWSRSLTGGAESGCSSTYSTIFTPVDSESGEPLSALRILEKRFVARGEKTRTCDPTAPVGPVSSTWRRRSTTIVAAPISGTCGAGMPPSAISPHIRL